jgi:hypothetical protein
MAFSLFLALVSQALPIQLYLDKKNSPPWSKNVDW